jgi:hypothetical protein
MAAQVAAADRAAAAVAAAASATTPALDDGCDELAWLMLAVRWLVCGGMVAVVAVERCGCWAVGGGSQS